MKYKKLPHEIFLKTFELVPRLALNLAIKNPAGKILLTKRLDPPLVNFWHFPGSFLLKDEPIEACLIRIAKQELGIDINPKNAKLFDIFEDIDMDPRGHVIDVIYLYSVKNISLKPINESKEIKFFSKIPKNIGFSHGQYLKKLGF